MDGDSLIRRWLAQQRELGDEELILPTMSARQAAEAIFHLSAPRPRARSTAPVAPAPALAPPVAAPHVPPAVSGDPGDWRTELSAAGAGPGTRGARRTTRTAPDDASLRSAGDAHAPLAPTPDVSLAATMDAVAELVAQCRACPLYKTARNPVPGEGNPNAEFVCVGEAPGATEDELGRPFVGAAGQLLTKILAAVKLEREDVFIMNVLKHRPPGNRNPDPAEVAACRPFLLRQLELLRPKVILALGTFAAQTLLETKDSLGKLRGRVHSFQGIPVVVTYHPAALLRNPAWKRPTWDDVQFARRILDVGPGA